MKYLQHEILAEELYVSGYANLIFSRLTQPACLISDYKPVGICIHIVKMKAYKINKTVHIQHSTKIVVFLICD